MEGDGEAGELYTKRRISNNSNVSITGVHDKKISGKTHIFLVFIIFLDNGETSNSLRRESPKRNR